MVNKLRITMTVEADTATLCDDESLREEFGGDWSRFVSWLADEEGTHFFAINWMESLKITKVEPA